MPRIERVSICCHEKARLVRGEMSCTECFEPCGLMVPEFEPLNRYVRHDELYPASNAELDLLDGSDDWERGRGQ